MLSLADAAAAFRRRFCARRLVTTRSVAVNQTLYEEPGCIAQRDSTFVANLASSPNISVAHSSKPASDLKTYFAAYKGKAVPNGSAGEAHRLTAAGARSGRAGLPGFEDCTWTSLLGPASRPANIVKRLNEVCNNALRSAGLRDKHTAGGLDAVLNTPADFADCVKREIAKWGGITKPTGIAQQWAPK